MANYKFKKGDWVYNKEGEFSGVITNIDSSDPCYRVEYIDEDGDYDYGYFYAKDLVKLKPKIGDEVKVRYDLDEGESYLGLTYNSTMNTHRGESTEIAIVNSNSGFLNLKGFMYSWTTEMLIPINKTPEDVTVEVIEENVANEDIKSELKNIASLLRERNSFDELAKEEIRNKIKTISEKEIIEDLHKSVDEYIKSEYGVLPKIIKVEVGEVKTELNEMVHKDFEKILKIVKKNVPLMLTGPAGAGKNHTLEQVAKSLGLDFYFSNAITQEYKLTGFIDANGVYQATQFYKAFKDGGLFFLDEIDASCPESLIILNSAIANGYFDFPNGRVNANENFRVVCAGNTYGTGADMVYVGRNALDGATLDRFATIAFDYDENIEKQLAYDEELYEFVKSLRQAIKETGLRYIVSMRATINASKLLEIGMSKKEILKSVIIKNMQIDDLNVIIQNNGLKKCDEWFKYLQELVTEGSGCIC